MDKEQKKSENEWKSAAFRQRNHKVLLIIGFQTSSKYFGIIITTAVINKDIPDGDAYCEGIYTVRQKKFDKQRCE